MLAKKVNRESYVNLLAAALPTVIQTKAENDYYLAVVEGLMRKGAAGLSKEEEALLDLLALLIETFEREDLREMVLTLNRTARVLAFETPGLENKFRLPRNTSDQFLLNAARAYAADAVPLKAGFLKHEMPADFIERLNQLITDFEKASTEKTTAVGTHVAAKITIDETVARG